MDVVTNGLEREPRTGRRYTRLNRLRVVRQRQTVLATRPAKYGRRLCEAAETGATRTNLFAHHDIQYAAVAVQFCNRMRRPTCQLGWPARESARLWRAWPLALVLAAVLWLPPAACQMKTLAPKGACVPPLLFGHILAPAPGLVLAQVSHCDGTLQQVRTLTVQKTCFRCVCWPARELMAHDGIAAAAICCNAPLVSPGCPLLLKCGAKMVFTRSGF